MSKQAKELYELLQGINGDGFDSVSVAIVESVDKDSCICVVQLNELPVQNVRLQSVIQSNTKGMKIFPAVGSTVLIKRIMQGTFHVCMYSEIDEVRWEIGDKIYSMTADGHQIANTDNSLLDVITTIVNAVMKTVVIYGENPDYAALQQALVMAQKILK